MSNRQLEAQHEARRDEWVAKQLGVEVDELPDLDLSVEEITGNDGAFYGYRAIVGPDADENLVQSKLSGSRAHHLGFMPEDDDGDT
jgi:hypothetical protein